MHDRLTTGGRPINLSSLEAEFPDLLTWRDGIFQKHWPLGAGGGDAAVGGAMQ